MLIVALLALAPVVDAQSGRIKPPPAKPSTSGAGRPKRATTGNDSQTQKPAPTPTPTVKLPSGTVVMDEAPPPAPAPRPTPVADASAGEEIGAEDVVKITSNLVTVPASVVDSQGRAVVDLRLEDFELRVDGQPRQISDLSRSEVPVTLALLFDNSESLSAAREIEKQAAVKFFRTVIRPIDRAAIYSVATDVDLVQPLTNNVPALVHTIDRFGKPEGATKLLDAIIEAATYLRPYPGRKVIIIVSDGEDTISDSVFDDVLRRVLTADCQVYAVQTKQIEYAMLTGAASNANLQALAAERRLQDLTSHTGGAVYTPLVSSDLDAAFTQISADLSQQYILSYYPSDDRSDGRFRTISVRIATRPNMRVRARRGYYPRRPNDRFSNSNAPPPGMSEPIITHSSAQAVQARATQRVVSPETDSLPALSSSAGMPERNTTSGPARSRRRGPLDSGDEPETSSNINTVSAVGATTTKGNAVTTRASEPKQPSPKPAAGPTPTPSPAPPSGSAAGPSAPKSAPPTSEATKAAPSQGAKPVTDLPFSAGVINGKALSLPKPQYPPNAKGLRAEGEVTVEVLLNEEGKVVAAKAVNGHAMLRQAAVDAARLARFSPTILSGKPVKVTGVIIYKFTLNQ